MFYLLFMKIYWNWKIVLLFILGNLVGVVHCGPYNPSDNSKKTLRTRLVAIRSCSAPRGPSYVGAFRGNTILPMHSFLQHFLSSLLHLREGLKKIAWKSVFFHNSPLPITALLQCSCILFYSIFFFALNDDLFHFFLPCFIFKTIAHLIRPNFRSNLSPKCVYTPKATLWVRVCKGLRYHYKEKIFCCLQMYTWVWKIRISKQSPRSTKYVQVRYYLKAFFIMKPKLSYPIKHK